MFSRFLKQMQNKNLVIAVITAALAVTLLLIIILKPSRVKQVTVNYTDFAARKAAQDGLSDADFIRTSGVMGKRMNELSDWSIVAADNIASMGGYELTEVKKTGSSAIGLSISARYALAVVKTGGWYYTIDSDGYIVDRGSQPKSDQYIRINGVSLRNPIVGQTAQDTDTEGRLKNAIEIIKLLILRSWNDYFTDIHMMDNKGVWLISKYNIPVKLSLWYEDTLENDIANAVYVIDRYRQSGLTGKVTSVNGHAYWDEDMDEFYQIKGK